MIATTPYICLSVEINDILSGLHFTPPPQEDAEHGERVPGTM